MRGKRARSPPDATERLLASVDDVVHFRPKLKPWDRRRGGHCPGDDVTFDDMVERKNVKDMLRTQVVHALTDTSWSGKRASCVTLPGATGTGKTMAISALATLLHAEHGIPTYELTREDDLRSGVSLPDGPCLVAFEVTNPAHATSEWKNHAMAAVDAFDKHMSMSRNARVSFVMSITCDLNKLDTYISN